jgi:hypothetical protein
LLHSREQHPGARVADHGAKLGGSGLRIDRHGNVAGTQSGEIGHHELDAVGSTDRDSMPRNQSVRRQPGSHSGNPSVELSPGQGAAYRPRLNKRYSLGLRFGLSGHKISKVGRNGPGVGKPERSILLVHPPESGTKPLRQDIMVMT